MKCNKNVSQFIRDFNEPKCAAAVQIANVRLGGDDNVRVLGRVGAWRGGGDGQKGGNDELLDTGKKIKIK